MLETLFDTTNETYVIFSTHQDGVALEAYLEIQEIGYKRLLGSWKGIEEYSWLVNAKDWARLYCSRWLDNQEAFMHLGKVKSENNPRPVVIQYYYGGTAPEFAGWFWQVSEEVAKEQPGWTKDKGQYYVAALEKPE